MSDWNHGNAHFLRGVATELVERGHTVRILEPSGSWSRNQLVRDFGNAPIEEFERAYPRIESEIYYENELDLDRVLDGAAAVIVHEWNSHALVARIGEHHARSRGYQLYFHDTHHRAATDPAAMQAYRLGNYDGVLAYGNVIRDIYLGRGWARRAWTWHEAADTRVFYPRHSEISGDLAWIGNWGDEERTEELREYLIEPVKRLRLRARVYGVRYPAAARAALEDAGIEYGGWLPNYQAPEVFARYRVTVHIPRRPYVTALPGIPTIRPFEAMACGIPLLSAPWTDAEHLFRPGTDFLFAHSGTEMEHLLGQVLQDEPLRNALAAHGLQTIRARHTCAHRVDELLAILAGRGSPASIAEPEVLA